MCTCITYQGQDFYFGRNLDLEYSFGEKVVITPRNYEFCFGGWEKIEHHYAMIGMAAVMEDYPLYAEAVNEKGLGMAGLNFPGNAFYQEKKEGLYNISPFELIPWILTKCASASEAEMLLKKTNIVNIPFREDVPLAPLHWMIADKEKCIVLEAVEEGMKIYENPYGVLTNNPTFEYHRVNMANYLNLMAGYPKCRFAKGMDLEVYGQGMGAIGLPGDVSPASRFVRAAFLKGNSESEKGEMASVTQFFHILDGVGMVKGSVMTREGKQDFTRYSCCVNGEKGIYYYKTYENNQICAVKMQKENLEQKQLISYEVMRKQSICYLND